MNLQSIPLTRDNFEEFGEVFDLDSTKQLSINNGYTTRFHDLFTIDVNDEDGRPLINIFRTSPLKLPHKITVMERHPLGSQGFLPIIDQPFLVLVGRSGETLTRDDLSLFITNGIQGVNLKKNTWHHHQIVLNQSQDFVVIDRGGGGKNLEETTVEGDIWITDSSSSE